MFFSCREVPKVDTSPCPYHMVTDIIIKKFLEKRPFIDENQHSIERLWNLLQSGAAGSHSAFSKAAGVGVIAILREHHQIKVRNGEIDHIHPLPGVAQASADPFSQQRPLPSSSEVRGP